MDNLNLNHSIKMIISSTAITRLYDEKFITESERQSLVEKKTIAKVKVRLYEILMEKDKTAAHKILDMVRSIENTTRRVYEQTAQQIFRTLQIEVILQTLFGYLNLDDIKSSRHVCRKWNKVAQPFLRKRSIIVFQRPSYCDNRGSMLNFLSTFNNSLEKTNVPFTSFKFESITPSDPFGVSELGQFFNKQKGNIFDLTFQSLVLKRGERQIEKLNLTKWLGMFPLKILKIITPSTKFKVPLHLLGFVEQLVFEECMVSVGGGEKISPTYISIADSSFFRDGNEMDQCFINDYIDFKKVKDLFLTCKHEEIQLDLNELVDVNILALTHVLLTNFVVAKCNVTQLFLSDISFLEKTQMKVTLLTFEKSTMDISCLPLELQFLKLINITLSCSRTVTLPYLKTLVVNNMMDYLELGLFRTCPALTDVSVFGHEFTDFEQPRPILDLSSLPKNIMKLKISDIENIIGDDDDILKLQVLVIDEMSFQNILSLMAKVKVRLLILPLIYVDENTIATLRQFQNIKQIYVGPTINSEKRGSFPDGYSLIVDRKGRTIDHRESQSIDSIINNVPIIIRYHNQ